MRSFLHSGPDRPPTTGLLHLLVVAIVSAVIYGVIGWLSLRFDYYGETTRRPIIAVLFLFAANFAGYLVAIRIATKARQSTGLVLVIVAGALAFRIVMLFSFPIQEVDIYRCIWDGAVSNQGVSPFRYRPDQVSTAILNDQTDPQLRLLVALRENNGAIAEVLRRVHFADLPTVYPPTSQAVFCLAGLTSPIDASVTTRVRIMKAWLIGFDLGVLFLVLKLLRACMLPAGLSITYAWCPLVVKEIANSGHLDSIAVFLTVLGLYLVTRALLAAVSFTGGNRLWLRLIPASIILAAAVGAKLYPVVLAPLVLSVLARRFGWKSVAVPSTVFVVMTGLLLWPMLPTAFNDSSSLQIPLPTFTQPEISSATDPSNAADGPATVNQPIGDPSNSSPRNDPSLGLTTFLKSWEMNDFIFMLLVENLKLNPDPSGAEIAWFSVSPDSFRQPIVKLASDTFKVSVGDAPFLITRFVTMLSFVVIALVLARRAANQQSVTGFCEAAFLTLAWFWLLLPTQNPWYWLWAMPLLPFVRNRAWFAVSGLVLVYYLRFWLGYHLPTQAVGGTLYQGTAFFDYVVTWLEYGPWFMWLLIERIQDVRLRVQN